MASLAKDGRLQFVDDNGNRQTICVGTKATQRQRESILRHTEQLIRCGIDGSAPPDDTSRWVASVGEKLHGKLVAKGLVQPKAKVNEYTVGSLVAEYMARPAWKGNKPKIRKGKIYGFKELAAYFGGDTPIKQITPARAMDFYCSLKNSKEDGGRGLAVSTSNLLASTAFTLLGFAIDSEAITRNPFKKVPRGGCKGNNVNVPTDVSLQVLDAMRGTQEKLLFGLSRWGGLRMPSEPLQLTWQDMDFENNRFLVHSPKTEAHEGCKTRWVPIFDELSELFRLRFEDATDGDLAVLPMLQGKTDAVATRLLQGALRRAGVEQWPRIWHSMRSTRQTELEVATGNRDIVCAWLGNSPAVAGKHYVNYTDDHFREAAAKVSQIPRSRQQIQGEIRRKGESRRERNRL